MGNLAAPLQIVLLLATAPYAELLRLYDYDRAAPLELREAGVEAREGIEVHDISFASPKGGRVQGYLVVPPGSGPFAGIVLMHGAGGSRKSVLPQSIMYAKTGAVCLALDAALSGSRAIPGEKFLDYQKPERTRDAFIQTVVDVRRGVDVLLARPDVDPHRLAYIGGSFGAFVGGVVAGVEKRVQAFALASAPASINEATVETVVKARETMPAEQLEKSFAIVDAVAAIHYVSHATPSALLFQSGTMDAGVPKSSAERLQRAASEPKTIQWYEAGHGLNNRAVLDRVEWLRRQIGIGPLDPADRKRLEMPRK
jgi:cephalosporin-C deacetylase-like acetyl esterase